MSDVNKVILTGNLTADPELKYLSNGNAVTTLRLATNRKYKAGVEVKEDVVYTDINVWGGLAENCAKYLVKGRSVLVDGRLKLDTWEKDEKKFQKLTVVADNVTFLSSGKKEDKSSDTENVVATTSDDVPF